MNINTTSGEMAFCDSGFFESSLSLSDSGFCWGSHMRIRSENFLQPGGSRDDMVRLGERLCIMSTGSVEVRNNKYSIDRTS